MTRYSCGFAFDESSENVALIKKERPEWQRGFLNGIGGHLEKGESFQEAMEREFKEETGLLDLIWWDHFVTLRGDDWICHFFRAFDVDLTKVETTTDEKVIVSTVSPLPPNMLHNLRWLIPLALDREPIPPTDVKYE